MDGYLGRRTNYNFPSLSEGQLPEDPIKGVLNWVNHAVQAELQEPTAMAIATVNAEGKPSNRFVLLRGIDEEGFIFYTNYESRKGLELSQNNNVAAVMWWAELARQVRIEGKAIKLDREASAKYFADRPRESQIVSSLSPQSRPIESTQFIREALVTDTGDEPIPYPENWGGFRIIPEVIEFWQGQPARLHDRFQYRRVDGGWNIIRLAP